MAASACAVRRRKTSTRSSSRPWRSTTSRSCSTSWCTRTRWCGPWSRQAPATTTSSSRAAWRPTGRRWTNENSSGTRASLGLRASGRQSMSTHTLSVLVENKPGVLARIAGLFSRRGFNIDSLAVGPTEHEEISRMTIVVNCEEHPLEQVTKQLNKLINVLKIVELEPSQAVQRELILIKVRADTDTRSKVLETVELFRAHVVDVALDAVTIEATGSHDKLEALVRVLEPFGLKELVQSGTIAVGRGGRSITDRTLRPLERTA